MNRTSKEGPPKGAEGLRRQISWLLVLIFAGTVLVLITESYDSTILKVPVLVAGSALLLILVILQWKHRPEFEFTWLHAFFVLLLLSGAASLFGASQLRNGLWALLTLSCLFVVFTFSAEAFRNPRGERLLQIALVAVALVTSIIGCVQAFLTTPSILFLTSGNLVVMSSLGNTSYYAGLLVLLFPVLLGIGIANRHHSALGPLCFGLLLVMVFLLVKTESRSSWLALTTALPFFFFLAARSPGKGWIYAGAALGALLMLGLLFPEIVQRRLAALFDPSGTSSFERRIYFYGGAWRAFLASPVIGNGIGNFILFLPKFRSPDYWIARSEDIVPHAHNEFLEILSETGILGIVAFFGIIVLFIKYARRAFPGLSGPGRFILAGYCAGLAAVLIDNLASMNLKTIPVAAGCWIVAGASMSYLQAPAFPLRFKISHRMAPLRFVALIALLVAAPFYVMHVSIRFAAEKIFMEGLMLKFGGDIQGATRRFEETLAADPLHQEASLHLLSNLIEQKEYRRASDLSTTLLREYPYAPKAHLLRAVVLFELGDKDQAEREIRREIAIAGYPQSYYFAAYFAGARGKIEEERTYLFAQLSECVRSRRTDYLREGLEKLSDVSSSGRKDSCLSFLRAVSDAFPGEPEILKSVMKEYMELGSPGAARSLAERLLASGSLKSEESEAILNGPTWPGR